MKARTAEIIYKISDISRSLAERLDAMSPGHPFGLPKYEHMRKMAAEAEAVALAEGFSDEEADLACIVFQAHDLGRHLEVVRHLDTLRESKRHGFLSAEILTEKEVLRSLPESKRKAVLDAIIHHAEREVALPSGSLAYRLCYLLRDYDKQEILEGSDSIEPANLLSQLELHVFPRELSAEDVLRLKADSALRARILRRISRALEEQETSSLSLVADFQEARVLACVNRFLGTNLDPALLVHFQAHRTLSSARTRQSLVAALLGECALLFDIHSDRVLNRVLHHPAVIKRFEILSRLCFPTEESAIRAAVAQFLEFRALEPGVMSLAQGA